LDYRQHPILALADKEYLTLAYRGFRGAAIGQGIGEMFARRMNNLRRRLADAGFDVALITDDDSVYYYTGYYDYLHMEFGRPTILVVPKDGKSLLITPSMELDMAEAAAVVDRIEAWNDGLGNEWREALPGVLKGAGPRCRQWCATISRRLSRCPGLAT
jgi:Xaa-Pro aminopeptidase